MFKKHLANKKIVVKKTAKFFKLHLNNFAVFLTLIAIIFTPLNSAFSAFNPEINYQGKLTNASNVAVADGDYNMEFKLYTASSGGTAIWTETLTLTNRVTVTNGLFSVLLGNVTSLSSIDFNQNLYLGVNIGGTPDTPSWDGEMSPRKQIASVPSAFESGKLDGLDSTQFLRSDDADSMASSSASTLLSLVQSGIGNILSLFDGATEVFTVKDGGNIGIGTTSPLSKLSVEGNSYVLGNSTVTGTITGGTFTDGTFSATSGAFTGVASITDGTASWSSNSLSGFTSISGTTLTDGTASITTGSGTGFTSFTVDNLNLNGAIITSDTGAISFDNENLATTGTITSGLINAQTISSTANFTGSVAVTGAVTGATSYNGLVVTANTGVITTGTWQATDVGVEYGGTGASTLTGLLQGNGTSAITGITGTIGQFPYYNGTNTLAATSTLTILTSGNIGIGTTSPLSKLSVEGNSYVLGNSTVTGTSNFGGIITTNGNWISGDGGAEGISLNSSGYVGIGTTTPAYKLDVNGNSRITGDLTVTGTSYLGNISISADNISTKQISAVNSEGLKLYDDGSNGIFVKDGGNVGIGTTAPGRLLHVSETSADSNTEVAQFMQPGLATNNNYALIAVGKSSAGSGTDPTAIFGYIHNTNDNLKAAYMGVAGLNPAAGGGLYVNKGGNVGIGTTAPGYALDIDDAATTALIDLQNTTPTGYSGVRFSNATGRVGGVGLGGWGGSTMDNVVYLDGSASAPVTLQIAGVEKMRVHTDGNVGIGTTEPNAVLGISGAAPFGGFALYVNGFVGTDGSNIHALGGELRSGGTDGAGAVNGALSLYNSSNAITGRIDTNGVSYLNGGNVGIGTTAPLQELDLVGQFISADNKTDDTAKQAIFLAHQYDSGTETEGFMMMETYADASGNRIDIGGGHSAYNAATALTFNTAANNTTRTGTERMRINSSGNVGIGTTAPGEKLEINGNLKFTETSTLSSAIAKGLTINAGANLTLQGGGDSYIRLSSNKNQLYKPIEFQGAQSVTSTSGDITITPSGNTIISTGNVGIGTTAPNNKLVIDGTAPVVEIRDGGYLMMRPTSDDTDMRLQVTGGVGSAVFNIFRGGDLVNPLVAIQQSGNVGIGTTGPGAKFVVAGDTTLSGDNGQIRIQGATDSNRKLYLGVDTSAGTSYGYIQSTESTVNTRALSLQPSGGNVGIGTTAPTTKLRVHGSTQITGFSNPTTSAGLEMGYDGTQGIIQAYDRDASGGKALWLNYGIGNVIMGGNVGIGTTTPSTKLAVEGMVYSSTGGFKLPDGTIIDGVEDLGVIGADDIEESMLKAVNSPTDEYFLTYESTTGDFEWQTAGTEFDSIAGLNAIFSGESVASTTWAGATSLTTLGTIATGVWQATDIGVEYGGTGASTLTGLLQGNGTSAVTGITGTTGQFPYYNGTNTLAATSAIFISGSNIGIGTTSPASSLDVAGTGITLGGVTRTTWPIGAGSGAFQDATTYAYYTGGNVGIGTTTVGARLTIADTYSQMKLMYDTDNYVDIGVDSTGSFALTPSSINATTTIGSGDEALRIDSSGNVGIGTTAPVQELDITGDINLQNTTSNDTGVIYKNNSRFIHNFQDATGGGAVPSGSNTFVGIDSGNFTMGSTATQIWHGSYNSALGEGTLTANTTGYYNSAIGYTSQASNTTGYSNASVGALALYSNTEGYYNSALGHGSAYSNTTGNQNTAVGGFALETNTTGSSNTAIGYDAGRYIADGETDNLTGDFNVFLGESTKPLADNDQNEIVIGYNATGLGSNTAVLGNDSITKTILKGNVGIGTTSPSYKLSVNSTSASENLFQIATTTNQNILLVDNDGRVGIGTSTLSNYNLTVHGSLYADDIYTSGSTFYMGGNALLSRTGTVLDFGVETGESIDFTINDTSAMNIATGGNVGIGTTGPNSKLEIASANVVTANSTGGNLNVYTTNAQNIDIGASLTLGGFNDNAATTFRVFGSIEGRKTLNQNGSSNGYLLFKTNTGGTLTEKVRITTDGNVGIGTTAPDTLLAVQGIITTKTAGPDLLSNIAEGLRMAYTATADTTTYRNSIFNMVSGSADTGVMQFRVNNGASSQATVMSLIGSGNVGIGTTGPGSKLTVAGTGQFTDWGSPTSGAGLELGYGGYANSGTIIAYDRTGLAYKGLAYDGLSHTFYSSGGSADLFIQSDGNVGIGTTAPTQMLQVGNWNSGGTASDGQIVLAKSAVNTGNRAFKIGLDDNYSLSFGDYGSAGAASYSPAMVIKYDTGNVGIGTTGPGYLLAVNGTTILGSSGATGANQGAVMVQGSTSSGRVDFYTHSGASNVYYTGAVGSAGISGGGLAFYIGSNAAHGAATFTEKMRLDNSGNVGIGTTAPSTKLSIKGDGTYAGGLYFDSNTNTNGLIVYHNGTNAVYESTFIGGGAVGGHIFKAGGATELMRITSTGNVGIGTTAPGAKLHVDTATNVDVYFRIGYAGNYFDLGRVAATGNLSIQGTQGGIVLAPTGGNVGIGTTAPGAVLEISKANNSYAAGAGLLRINSTGTETLLDLTLSGTMYGRIRSDSPGNLVHVATGGQQEFWTNGDYGTGNLRMVIQNTGNVGIGTTGPAAPLDVSGNISVYKADVGYPAGVGGGITFSHYGPITAAQTGSGIYSYRDQGDSNYTGLAFKIHNSATTAAASVIAAVISTSGNVGIGTTAPAYQLQLSTDSAAKPGTTTWTVPSDERLKDVNGDFTRGLTALSGLYPSYFNYKDDNALDIPSDREYVGLIAQDVQAVIPEAVKEGQDGYLSVESDPIFWTMLNAIKELALKVGSDNITYTRDTLQVLNDTDAPQMKLAYDLENLAEFKVSAVGDLSISSAGKDIRLPDDNMLVCSSGACPILTSPFLGVQPPQGNAVQNFEKLTSGTGNLIVENVAFIAGVMGIGTPAPSRILDVYETGENPQMRVSYDESNFAEMQVNAVGDLLLSSVGKDIRLLDDNMLVCSGGACPILTSPFLGVQPPQGNAVQNFEKLTSGTGNLIVENVAYIAGALGIGTPAPSRILDVYEPQSDPQFRISYDEDLYSEFNVSATGDLTISAAGGDISVLNENLRVCSDDGCPSIANEIESSGNIVVENSLLALGRVGIGGTISPDYTLDVHGTLRAYGITDASDARLKTNIRSLSKGSFPYEEPTLPAGRLATEGVRPLGQTSPTLQNIQKLRGVKFEWKNSEFGTGDQIGMIAQEMEQVYPELVSTDNDGYKSVQYGKFTAILLEAVKDLINFGETIEYRSARLEDRTVELEKKNRELENRIKALENILRQ